MSNTIEEPFQKRVLVWLTACFPMEVCRDGTERNHRFLEEALELVQSLGCTRSEAQQLVAYVFDRPVGEPVQELGGVMVTLAALCYPHGLDLVAAAETELARVWTKIDKIREKQAAKPEHSPLPEHILTATQLSESFRYPDMSHETFVLMKLAVEAQCNATAKAIHERDDTRAAVAQLQRELDEADRRAVASERKSAEEAH